MADGDFEKAMAVGRSNSRRGSLDDIEVTTGEHRVVPRVIINPRSDYSKEKSNPRRKPDICVVRFSPDGALLGCALSNGRIAMFDTQSGRCRYNMDSADPRHERHIWHPDKDGDDEDKEAADDNAATKAPMTLSPMKMHTPKKDLRVSTESLESGTGEDEHERPAVVAMRWWPSRKCKSDGFYKLLTSNSDGVIQRWRITSPNDPEMVTYRSNRLKRTGTEDTDGEEDHYDYDGTRCTDSFMFGTGYESAALGLDFDTKGERFVAGCKDSVVRVFDNETSKVITTLDGGKGVEHVVESEFLMMGDMSRFYSVMERRRLKKATAREVIDKVNIKSTGLELRRENVVIHKRHSNRVYGCKFTSGHAAIAENLIASAGWDGTLQLWDLRVSGPPVKGIHGAFIAGDALDICGNDILTGSHRWENQLQIYDLRFEKEPKSVHIVEGNLLYSAAFSKGDPDNLGSDRFFTAGGVGPGAATNDLKIFDHKRDNQLAATISDLPGGVVSVDWDPFHTHPATATSPMNSSKGSVPGGMLAIGCGDSSIRIVEICTQRSSKFMDDAEEEVEDGEETDSELFEDYMDQKYGDQPEAIREVREKRSKHTGIPLPNDSPLAVMREKSRHFNFSPEHRSTIRLDLPGADGKAAVRVSKSNDDDDDDDGGGGGGGEDRTNQLVGSQSEPVLSPRVGRGEGEDEAGDLSPKKPLRGLKPPKGGANTKKGLANPLLSPAGNSPEQQQQTTGEGAHLIGECSVADSFGSVNDLNLIKSGLLGEGGDGDDDMDKEIAEFLGED